MSILVLTSDTLIGTPATGNIEYNGQFYGTDSNASRAQMQRITLGTVNAGGANPFNNTLTAVDFTGIPSWVKRITVMFNGVSTNGSALVLIQLGTASSIETTGYSGSTQYAASYVAFSSYTGVPIDTASTVAAATVRSGQIVFNLLDSSTNTWAVFGGFGLTTAAALILPAGTKALASVLTRLRITTSGSDTFDAGSINILYEG